MENNKEIWQDIPSYEKQYQASTFGNVRSLKYGRIKDLKPLKSNSNYLFVNLWNRNKIKSFFIHKLIAMTFLNHIPNGFNGKVIDHIDRNRLNNNLSNLRIINQRENCMKDLPKSGYHGVVFNSVNKKWQVRPKINKMNIHFSYFDCLLLAHYCYLEFTAIIDNANIGNYSRLEIRGYIKEIRGYIKEMRVSVIEYTKSKYAKELLLFEQKRNLSI